MQHLGEHFMTLTESQIEARRKSIGGSDIAAILGENNYKTAYELWEEKVEGKSVDLSNNKSVVIGQILELPLIEKYEKIHEKLCILSDTFYHKNYDFLSANLDAVMVQDYKLDLEDIPKKRIVEIKTASCFNKDDWGPSGSQIIPKHYYAQIAYYMLVTGYKSADVFVGFIDETIIGDILCEMNFSLKNRMIPNYSKIVEKMETRVYTFYKDEETEELILEAAKSFYNDYMRPWIEDGIKNAPPMDFSNKNFREHLKKKYSIIDESEIMLPDEYIDVKNKYLLDLSQSKMFDKMAQEEKSKIVEIMGNNQKALLSDGSYFSRKTIKRKEFTIKASEYIKFELKQPKEIQGEI